MLKYRLISLKILESLKDFIKINFHPLTSLPDSESNYLIGFDQSTSQSPHALRQNFFRSLSCCKLTIPLAVLGS